LIAIFSALKEEVVEFKKQMSVTGTSRFQQCRIIEGKFSGRDCLLILTGVGKENARQATEMALGKYPVSVLISAGFGGALNEKTKVGDIVVCSRLINGEDRVPEQDSKEILESNLQLLAASKKTLEDGGMGFIIGTGVTVPFVSSTPENKIALGTQFGADMVEMESYWIAKLAADRKLPFIEVRSIFDSLKDDLSLLSEIMSKSKVRKMTALANCISHPKRIQMMSHLASNAKIAERNLAVFLSRLITEI
jgi:adenosylhomocysteine nucleosidase